jgi:hypothetical protein
MNPPSSALIAAVQTKNAFNLVINSKIRAAIPLCANWTGKKIWAVSQGEFVTGVKKEIANSGIETDKDGEIRCYFSKDYSSLCLKFSWWHDLRSHYDSVYIGQVNDAGVLIENCLTPERCFRQTDFDPVQISETNQKIKELEEQIHKLKDSIPSDFWNRV